MIKENNLLPQLSKFVEEVNDLLDLYDAVEYYLYPSRFCVNISNWEEKAALERLEYIMKRIKDKKRNE